MTRETAFARGFALAYGEKYSKRLYRVTAYRSEISERAWDRLMANAFPPPAGQPRRDLP